MSMQQEDQTPSVNPFNRLYVRPAPSETCDEYFAHLCEVNFGMSRIGAQKHFEDLRQIPEGYKYHGVVTAAYGQNGQEDNSLIVLSSPAHDIDGREMHGHVKCARRISH